MRRNYLFSIILTVAVLGKVTNVSAQNVTYACNTVNISIADIIGIVDTASNQIDVFTEETAFNMGIVSFEYPNALFYGTSQTESSGSCYVSASTPFRVTVRATTATFNSGTVEHPLTCWKSMERQILW